MDTDFQAAFEAGAAQYLEITDICGIAHTLVPATSKVVDFARLMPAPQRIFASPCFSDLDGFAQYFNEFKEGGTRIFVDDKNNIFTTVFDCHAPGKPAWGDHSCSFRVTRANEWARFLSNNNRKMEQGDFAEWLEDNHEYITGPITGIQLLELAQNINVNFKGSLEVNETIARGLKKLVIRDDSRAYGTDTNGLQIEFPEVLTVSLRVFKNGPVYDFKIRLRQRINKDKNGLVFWYTLADPDALEESVFNIVIENVGVACGVRPLRGAYSGQSHK